MLFIQSAVCAILVATAQIANGSPLLGRTSVSGGTLRPVELITRSLEVVNLQRRQNTSTDSDCGIGGCTSSGAAANDNTAASSSSSCEFLGGCSSGAGAACPTEDNNVGNTSSSVCGSSTSTDSSGFLGINLGSGSKLVRRIVAAFSQ